MSIHHLERAGELRMQATRKLVLMAMCDDADKTTGLAMPGIEKVMQWASCGKSQALEHVAALIEAGYLERVESGHRGRRAVYRVFARVACCAEHPAPIESGQSDPFTNGQVSGNGSGESDPRPVDNRSGKGPFNRTHSRGKGPERVRKGSGKGPVATGPPPSLPTPQHQNSLVVVCRLTNPNGSVDDDGDLIAGWRKQFTGVNLEIEADALLEFNRSQLPANPSAAWLGWLRTAQQRATASITVHGECPTHPGHLAHNCGGCRADARGVDRPRPPCPIHGIDTALTCRRCAAERSHPTEASA